MRKTIGLTYDVKPDWVENASEPSDANAEFDKPLTIDAIQSALESEGHIVKRIGNFEALLNQIDKLEVDIVFNICEGRNGRNRESTVPNLLEARGIPFVGSDALTLGITLDKAVCKKMLVSEKILTPRFFVVYDGEDAKAKNTLEYPLMVKTRHEGSSKGITEKSRVTNDQELLREVEKIHKIYKQSALVEEFIIGSEFTVAVLGNEHPQAMPVVQYGIDGKLDLGNEFYTQSRLVADCVEYICPAKITEKLEKDLRELAVKVYRCVECKDFGRIDFRVDHDGNIYCLEANPYPSLERMDTFDMFPREIGSTYEREVCRILDYAFKRYGLVDEVHHEMGQVQ